jgi:hypothetical protein
VKHQFPTAIANLIKYEVWPDLAEDGHIKHAEVCSNEGIDYGVGRRAPWDVAVVSQQAAIMCTESAVDASRVAQSRSGDICDTRSGQPRVIAACINTEKARPKRAAPSIGE